MKDAIGSSLLVYLLIIIVGIVGVCVIASNSYSKAYKAKNNIIDHVNKYYLVNSDKKSTAENNASIQTDCFNDQSCIDEINETLADMGYRFNVSDIGCQKLQSKITDDNSDITVSLVYPKENSNSSYCAYKVSTNSNDKDYYYSIITYSYFKISSFDIGTLFHTPVYGDTRVYYDYSKGD